MSHNFKPGDLALVIDAFHESNLGMVVELVRKTNGTVILLPDDRMVGNPESKECWVVTADGIQNTNKSKPYPFRSKYAAAPESSLMPLNGEFDPEQEKYKEGENCR